MSWPGSLSYCCCDSVIVINSNIVFTLVCNFQGCEQGFTHITENPFTSTHDLIPFGGGIRIDYILFKVNVLDFTVGQIASTLHLHSLALFSGTPTIQAYFLGILMLVTVTHLSLHVMSTHSTDNDLAVNS